MRQILSILGIAIALLTITSLVGVVVLSVSLFWAGFWMLILYQAYHLVQTFFNLWSLASQNELYRTKTIDL